MQIAYNSSLLTLLGCAGEHKTDRDEYSRRNLERPSFFLATEISLLPRSPLFSE